MPMKICEKLFQRQHIRTKVSTSTFASIVFIYERMSIQLLCGTSIFFLKIHPCSPPSLLQPDIANFLIWTFHGLVSGNFENLRILLTRLFSSSCQKHKIIQAANSIFPNPFLFRAWWWDMCVCCILKPCDSNTSLLCVCYALAHSCLQLSKHSKKFYRLKK